MFRTQNNVPEIYVNKSRDFQLMARLKDLTFGGVKYAIDSLRHTANTLEMNNVLLPLLKSKVGFFSDDTLSDEQLRILLLAFPVLIKSKGSEKSIRETIYAWFKLNQMVGDLVSIDINPADRKIILYIASKQVDTALLDEIFKYTLPTAYELDYRFAYGYNYTDELLFSDDIHIMTVNNSMNSKIRTAAIMLPSDGSVSASDKKLANKLIGTVGATEIANATDISSEPEYEFYNYSGEIES